MKAGKLPGVVEKRSVFMLNQAEGVEPARVVSGAASDGRFTVLATDQTGIFGNDQTKALRIGALFDRVRAMLAAQGADVDGEAFTISLSLPPKTEEAELKKLSAMVAQEVQRCGIASYAVHAQGRYEAEGCEGIVQMTVVGVGVKEPEICSMAGSEDETEDVPQMSADAPLHTEISEANPCGDSFSGLPDGDNDGSESVEMPITDNSTDEEANDEPVAPAVKSIVMVGYAALEATAVLISEKREILLSRLAAGYLAQGLEKVSRTDICEAARLAVCAGAVVKTAGEGGVFGALWELGEYFDCGMDIILRDILLLQETIEVCEVLDVNPYLLTSGGCILAVTEDAQALLEKYEEAGIAAAVIGNLKEGHDRVIHNEWEERFLEPFRAEELYRVLS